MMSFVIQVTLLLQSIVNFRNKVSETIFVFPILSCTTSLSRDRHS